MMTYEESMQYFRGYGLVQFDDLSDESKLVAIENVLSELKRAHTKDILKAKEAYKSSPNKAINDSHHIKRIINGMNPLIKYKSSGVYYLCKLIRSNLIWFLPNGDKPNIYTYCTPENKV